MDDDDENKKPLLACGILTPYFEQWEIAETTEYEEDDDGVVIVLHEHRRRLH